MNILIVDDEAAACRDLETVLKNVATGATILQASNAAGAVEICRSENIDVAFLDVRMPKTDGLKLAEELVNISPDINIIMVTAYPEYALEAHRLFVSGYILKPAMEDEVKKTLEHLRVPPEQNKPIIHVQCFGNFEVFYQGKPLKFKRSQSKELFAYLIDRRGASVTNAECCAVLWGDTADGSSKQRDYFHHIWGDLKDTLTQIGCGDVLSQERNAYAVIPDKISCDYYDRLASEKRIDTGSVSEYMSQYSWAEGRLG